MGKTKLTKLLSFDVIMTAGTVIQCSREAKSHRGGLMRVQGELVCEECRARENGHQLKRGAGRPVICPRCGEELMTRYRNGGVSVKSLSMHGSKATLTCTCGHRKTIKNPFGGYHDRNEAARQALRRPATQAKQKELREE